MLPVGVTGGVTLEVDVELLEVEVELLEVVLVDELVDVDVGSDVVCDVSEEVDVVAVLVVSPPGGDAFSAEHAAPSKPPRARVKGNR